MQFDGTFALKPFAEVDYGALVLVFFGRRAVVRGIKASYASEGGVHEPYFVSLGPFVPEHGDRPAVYRPGDLSQEFALDLADAYTLSPSMEPGDIHAAPRDTQEAPGAIVLAGDRTLMRVANFGRAGPAQIMYVDLETGELVGPPDTELLVATHRWRLVGRSGRSSYEFKAASED